MSDLLRLYLDPAEITPDGYPNAWHRPKSHYVYYGDYFREEILDEPSIKDYVREQAGHRCIRCGHPYLKGQHGNGEWSDCGPLCVHQGPFRVTWPGDEVKYLDKLEQELGGDVVLVAPGEAVLPPGPRVEAQWRILTVHHLNGVKHDCRWWNLVALCQRCHLSVQTRVVMDRPYIHEHSDWFKPYVAGFYAWHYLGEELERDEVEERLDELLALEHRQERLPL